MSDPQTQLHEEKARDMMDRIKAIIKETFPNVSDATPRSRRRLSSVASIPDAFLEEVGDAIDLQPEAGVLNHITSPEARDMIVYSHAYDAFGEQLIKLGRSVLFTVAEQRADVGRRALDVYNTIKGSTRDRTVTPLKRALGKRGSRKKPADATTPEAVKKVT